MLDDVPTTQRDNAGSKWLVALLAAMWIIPGLFGHEPWKPDEGYTIGLIKSMVDSGNWIVPTLTHETFMEKPPIFFITTALLASIIPPGLLALHQIAALTAALYVGLTLYFVHRAGRENGGMRAGDTAALGLIGCVGFVVRAHSAITDTALWCGFAMAVYGVILAERKRLPGALWFGTGTGLAFMAKGLLGPGFLGLAVLLLPLVCPKWRNAGFVKFLLWSLVFSLPWLLIWPYALYRHSSELFTVWLMDNNFGRFLGPEYGFPPLATRGKPWKYLAMLPWFTLPLWPAVLLAWAKRGRAGLAETGMAYPLLVFVVGLTALSAAATRRDLYFIPLLVPLAVMAGRAGVFLTPSLEWLLRRAPWGLFLLAGVLCWSLYLLLRISPPHTLTDVIDTQAPGFAFPPSLFLPLTALGYFAFCGWILIRSRLRLSWDWVWGAGMTLAWGTAMLLYVPLLDYTKGYHPTFAAMLEQVPEVRTAHTEQIFLGESQRAILDYYFGVVFEPVRSGQESADYLFVQTNRRFLYHPDASWQLVWEGARPGDSNEKYRLYRKPDNNDNNAAEY